MTMLVASALLSLVLVGAVDVVSMFRLKRLSKLQLVLIAAFFVCRLCGLALYFGIVLLFGFVIEFFVAGCALSIVCAAMDVVLSHVVSGAIDRKLVEMRLLLVQEQSEALRARTALLDEQALQMEAVRRQAVMHLDEASSALNEREAHSAQESLDRSLSAIDGTRRRMCAHPVVDALLSLKANAAHDAGIDVEFSLDVSEDLPYSGLELTAVFSNLFDNALHACAGVTRVERLITVRAFERGGFFVVEVVNPYLDTAGEDASPQAVSGAGPAQAVSGAGPAQAAGAVRARPASGGAPAQGSLVPEHGWGMTIVEGISEQHHGLFEAKREDGVFRAVAALSLA